MPLARWQRNITTDAGVILPGASVEVRKETDNTVASLFSDRAGSIAISNPFAADSQGFAAFHVVGGAYKITITFGSFTRVLRYVGIGLAQEFDVDQLVLSTANLPPIAGGTVLGRADGAAAGAAGPLDKTALDIILRTFLGRTGGVVSTPLTLLASDSGKIYTNFNANRVVNLPTIAQGLSFAFYTLDGGSGGNLTINAVGGANILMPSGVVASVVIPNQQHLILGSDGSNWVVIACSFAQGAISNAGPTAFVGPGVLTPSQITSNQNDYNPTGQAVASVLRLSVDVPRDVTGLANGANYRVVYAQNVGTRGMGFPGENISTASSTANRFGFPGRPVLGPGEAIEFHYDPTAARWKALGGDIYGNQRNFAIGKRYSTNVISVPYFNEGKWFKEGNTADILNERYSLQTNGTTERFFDYRLLQMFLNAAGSMQSSYPNIVPVDLTQAYRLAIYAIAGAAAQTMQVLAEAIDTNGDVISTLTFTTPALPTAFADNTSELGTTINANGGGAPAWPNGTVGARVRLNVVTATVNYWVAGVWLVQQQRMTNTLTTKVNATSGGGTHEAFWDGTNLFTLSHTFGQVAKFDANLIRQAVVTTSNYPHDVVGLGGDIWIVTQLGQTLQQINKAAMTVTNTFAINGTRDGFGIATDGTDLYLGIGNSGAGQTPAIVKFTVSGSSQAVLSTDVNGGAANVPVVFQNGSVWSIVQANSQVKRINPSGGATIATITAAIGGIYGLGGDGTFIYAGGEKGIAVVDPASNTVISTYFFSKQYGMGSNSKVDSLGRMWGCSRNGLWMLNQATGMFTELPGVLGGAKWARPMSGGAVVVGYFGVPWLDVF